MSSSPEPQVNKRLSVDGVGSASHDDRQSIRDVEAHVRDLVGSDEQRLLFTYLIKVESLPAAARDAPVLQTPFALALLDHARRDCASGENKIHEGYFTYVGAMTKQVDEWTADFLNRHQFEDALVLELGCGVDSRHERVRGDHDVKWVDVDRARVLAIRECLYPCPQRDYELLAADLGEDDYRWLEGLPTDRPVLIIMEYLLPFMCPHKGERLFKRLLAHFRSGNIILDTFGTVALTHFSLVPRLFGGGAMCDIQWGIDDAKDIEKLDSRLVLRNRVYTYDYMTRGWSAKGYPPIFGPWTPLITMLPKFKKHGQILHFEF